MLHPSTPTKAGKADDGIERLKQSLSAKWGIQFPVKDSTWSPSRRDPNRVEDRILAVIQFLYFRDGALHYAIEQFEKTATTVYSKWQFKPRGEADVLPSREGPESAVKRDFLHKCAQLEESAIKELTESLWLNLSLIKDRVKAGEKFLMLTMPSIEKPKAVSVEPSPNKANASRRQSSLMQWFRSTSDPNPATNSPATATHHPSSDDFLDEDMADAFSEAQKDLDTSLLSTTNAIPHTRPTARVRRTSEQTSSTEERFETPPTIPPRLRGGIVGLGIGANEDNFYHKKSELVPVTNKKRSYPEPTKPPLPRKTSRETRSQRDAYNVDHLTPTANPDNQKKQNQELDLKLFHTGNAAYAVPTPPPGDKPIFSVPRANRSFDNLTSVSSSMMSASNAWTTPNTSFSSDSMATSFSSSTGGTETTIRASADTSWDSLLARKSAMQFEADENEWDYIYQAQTIKPPKINSTISCPTQGAPSNAMSLHKPNKSTIDLIENDSGSTIARTGKSKEASMAPPPGPFKRIYPTQSLEEQVADRLDSHSPFALKIPERYSSVPLRQLYEVTRVATHCKLDLSDFSNCLHSTLTTYEDLWSCLRSITRAKGAQVPERSSLTAWERAGSNFEGVALSGTLKLLDQQKGPLVELRLSPLKIEPSYRLSREFGSDRFCVLGLPGLGPENLPAYLKQDPAPIREAIIKWLIETEHHLLGRTWRAFYTKPDTSKRKALKGNVNLTRYRVFFFAEDGVRFRYGRHSGELDPRILDRPQMSVRDLIEWLMPAKMNEKQLGLKFFARLAIGVSSTVATVEFKPFEIFRADDARADDPGVRRLDYKRSEEKKKHIKSSHSDAPVMNDGCARISREAARGIADSLGLNSVPCAFQGRIGGAKGVWMIDLLNETPTPGSRNFWVEITDQQLKFEAHPKDALYAKAARVTFEVNDYAKKLLPGSLNFQLLPILEDRKVPPEVFMSLLEKDLTARVAELEVAMDSGLALRKWNQTYFPVTAERTEYGGIEMQGGLPQSRSEKIDWFVEHGFEPKTCRYLKEQLYQAILAYCLRLESKVSIGLPESTYAFMIADPLAILGPDEVHIGFSSAFKDPKTNIDQTMLHDLDVLVARSPAHLPSDIQKVRAVFKPELRNYRDVIVFPSKGLVSLASKLSGGDYDGDKAWICWDSDIVAPFKNAEVPEHPPVGYYGIEQDKATVADLLHYPGNANRFLRHAFNFNLQMNMLGTCTLYHEALCYHMRDIKTPQAIAIAVLLGSLVDSAKGGYKFDDAKWSEYLMKNGLRRNLSKPAYKDRNKAKPTNHLIDHLVFVTARETREEVLKSFANHFKDVSPRDNDLFRIRNEAAEEAKSSRPLAQILKNLESDLKTINTYWRQHVKVDQDDEDIRPTNKPDSPTFRTVVERCREDFLKLAPTLDASSTDPISDRISSWHRDHARGRSCHWDLLKASVAFYHNHKSTFIWHIAGVELGEIKAMARGRGWYRVVVGEVHEAFKLDPRVVDGARRREMRDLMEGEEGGKLGDEEGDDDTETDFGGDGLSQVDWNDFGF